MAAGVSITRWGGIQANATSGNVAAAAATATISAGGASVYTYLTGFEVTGAGATVGSVVAVSVFGLIGGTFIYNLVVPTGATASITPLIVQFPYPLRSSSANTNIVVSAASFGAGNTNACVNAHGYYSAS